MNRLTVLTAMLTMAAFALTSYTGYSGAPGSRGSCASSCHGNPGGTITVTGFPASYTLGQAYTVSLGHDGGSSIRNFNASARIGTGSETAGEIAAGLNTVTYSRSQELNGVHLSGSNKDTAEFTWTAPDTGVGTVRLYVAGLQGSMSGNNTALVLVADHGTGVEELPAHAARQFRLRVEPTLVTRDLVMNVSTPAGTRGTVLIVSRAGRIVERLSIVESNGTEQSLRWTPAARGQRLPAGDYVAALVSDGELLAVRFTVVR